MPHPDTFSSSRDEMIVTEAFRRRATAMAERCLPAIIREAGYEELQELIATVRSDKPEPDVRALRGWRRELLGGELLDLLGGRRSLRVGADGRIVIEG